MTQYNPYEAEVSDAGSESPNRLFQEDNLSPRRIIRLNTKIIVCMTCNRELGVVVGRFELLINVLLKPSANIRSGIGPNFPFFEFGPFSSYCAI
jgi:hypothetical protein